MFWIDSGKSARLKRLFGAQPAAIANIKGDEAHSSIKGLVSFHPADSGLLIVADISGLPYQDGKCGSEPLGFHIHEGDRCAGNVNDPFSLTGGHYNPNGCEHPHHAGDMPPLFSNKGFAWNAFYTERMSVSDVIGKTVVIHSMRDDFTTQPSGGSGAKIACGVINWR